MAEPQWSPDSARMQELAKWDRPKRDYVTKSDGTREYGEKCNGFEPFPKMLYKAQPNPLSGKYEAHISRDVISADRTTVILNAEQFNTSCQLIVRDEREYERAKADGWRDSPGAAIEYHNGTETEKMVGEAVRNYEDRNMSPEAKAEAAKYAASTAEHVPEIPESRKRKAS